MLDDPAALHECAFDTVLLHRWVRRQEVILASRILATAGDDDLPAVEAIMRYQECQQLRKMLDATVADLGVEKQAGE
jgi:hypothetical protein